MSVDASRIGGVSRHRQLASFTLWTSADSIIQRVSDALFQLIPVFFLASGDYALLGLAASYLSLTMLVSLQPTSALLRYYPAAQASGTGMKLLQSCAGVVVLKLVYSIVLACLLACVVSVGEGRQLAQTLFLYCLFVELRLVQGAYATILRLSSFNRLATLLTLAGRILLFLVAGALWLSPHVQTYLITCCCIQCALTATVALTARRRLSLRLRARINDVKEYWPVIREFVGWSHLAAWFISLNYTFDVLVLRWTGADLESLGAYCIALRISSLMFVVPMAIQGGTTLSVASAKGESERITMLGAYLRIGIGLAILQMLLFVVFARPLLEILFSWKGAQHAAQAATIAELALWLCLAVTFLNMFRPLIGYAIATMNMRKYLVTVAFPSTLVAVVVFASVAPLGVRSIALCNLIVYPVLGILVMFQSAGPRLTWKALTCPTKMERSVIQKVVAGRGRPLALFRLPGRVGRKRPGLR